jgi:hypothetical protein
MCVFQNGRLSEGCNDLHSRQNTAHKILRGRLLRGNKIAPAQLIKQKDNLRQPGDGRMRSLQTVAGLKVSARLSSFRCALAIPCLACCAGPEPVRAAQASATTLSLTSGGNAVSSVAGGTVVTLTATVQAGATTLMLGQVNFCDATAASCTDIHLVGTVQLTSAGSAVLRFRPGPGSHSYKAVFLGTLAGAASSSAAVGLTVGPRPPGLQTTFTIASVAGPDATNMYALTASVGTKGAISPSGTVSFLDTNNTNSLLGTATLVGGGNGFLNVPIPEPLGGGADALPIVAVGDFNGDGIPDIVSTPMEASPLLWAMAMAPSPRR